MKPGQDRINSKPAAEWPPDHVPAFGEICFNSDTGQYKYGDGVTRHADLPISVSGLATQKDLTVALAGVALKSDLADKVDASQVTAIATQIASVIVSTAIAAIPKADPVPVTSVVADTQL